MEVDHETFAKSEEKWVKSEHDKSETPRLTQDFEGKHHALSDPDCCPMIMAWLLAVHESQDPLAMALAE